MGNLKKVPRFQKLINKHNFQTCSFLFCLTLRKKRDPVGSMTLWDFGLVGAVGTTLPSLYHVYLNFKKMSLKLCKFSVITKAMISSVQVFRARIWLLLSTLSLSALSKDFDRKDWLILDVLRIKRLYVHRFYHKFIPIHKYLKSFTDLGSG